VTGAFSDAYGAAFDAEAPPETSHGMDLYALSLILLDRMVEQMNVEGIALPDLKYVAPGNEVPFDCEQFTVNLTRIISNFQTQDTTYPTMPALLMSSAEFYITCVRCVPTFDDQGNPPPAKASSDAAGQIMRDSRAMRRALEHIVQQCLVAPRNVPQTVGELRTIGPSGGLAASAIMYSVMLVDDWWVDNPQPALPRRIRRTHVVPPR
jgi:hypothetical protein